MTTQEFSNNWDTLIGSYINKVAFGQDSSMTNLSFDEYEKSYFLTESEKEIVVGLYSGRNPFGLSFEETEELRRYLAPLIAEAELSPIENSSGVPLGVDSKSKFFTLPDGKGGTSANAEATTAGSDESGGNQEGENLDGETTEHTEEEVKPAVWFITYEAVVISNGKCDSHTSLEVVPVTQDEYHRLKKNPFRGANDRRALRLDLSDGVIEIVSKYDVTKYYVRYLRKPKPIILEELPDGLSIDGEVGPLKPCCELPEVLHQMILERAVEMAVRSRTGAIPQSAKNKEE